MKPTIPFGSSENPFKRKEFIGQRIKKRYDQFKSLGHKHGGVYMFTSPSYLPIDPEYIKNIMQRDFQYFMDRGAYYNEKDDPLTAHLFNLEGQKWKNLRSKLTPTFTSGKMKMMFPIMIECTKQLLDAMDEFYTKKQAVDVKSILSSFTTDIIGSCAFGLECNSFTDANSKFIEYGKRMFTSISKSQTLSQVIVLASPDLGRRLGIVITPREISDFFINIVRETIEYRRKANVVRKDFLQILMDLQDTDKNTEGALTIEEVAAQAFVFFLAGYETSSSTMSFCLFELALNANIQEKVRNEIFNTLKGYNGEITYEAITDLKYLGQVVDETLRKYPPASVIPRTCTEDYNIPETNVVIEKGTRLFIPIYALHHDEEYYPNPDVFDPDRFSEENRNKRHPFTYMPFGEGPRICIGLRFGLIQTKIGLVTLLKNYRFSVSTRTKIPLEIDPTNLVLSPKDGIWLELERLTD
ncbi:hypothetical protein ILUMI_26906 [Ignelater luminosus]|uniref:Cytochrome P450 n=1 Tax=Ignelater luminosus TaxID=2038154 RepID=A0A8K0C3E7_IGNLU|nr:hypothetical protein ILUMI_26906 [Ignelater luminosus]